MSGRSASKASAMASDKLVTVDVKPGSPTYGKVISSVSVGGRNEAHHGGFTDDRRQLWLAGLETSKIFIFDVHTDPAKPRLVKTIDNFAETTGGAVGPARRLCACPGRVLIPCLSNAKDKGGRTALVEYSNDGNYIATHWMPTKDDSQAQPARSSPTATATTRAFCRARTRSSPRPSPA